LGPPKGRNHSERLGRDATKDIKFKRFHAGNGNPPIPIRVSRASL